MRQQKPFDLETGWKYSFGGVFHLFVCQRMHKLKVASQTVRINTKVPPDPFKPKYLKCRSKGVNCNKQYKWHEI